MKIACAYHRIDLDGWMSAAVVKYWFENYVSMKSDAVHTIDFIGFNYGDVEPDLSDYDEIMMCDISLPAMTMINMDDRLVWIDHHISAINDVDRAIENNKNLGVHSLKGLRDTKFAACELTWKFLFPEKAMPEIVRLLGRYDCFGHKNTSEERSVFEFQYGARGGITNYEDAYAYLRMSMDHEEETISVIMENGVSIYKYLCTEAKQTYKDGFDVTLVEPNVEDVSAKRRFICFNRECFNPINFELDYHGDGYDGAMCFHYLKGKWSVSLYNDNSKVDVSAIAKSYKGGGHRGAAGFVIDDINEILKTGK